MSEELSPWQRYKQNLGDTRPWDALNPNTNWVDKDIHISRFNLCKVCPEFISLTTQCKKCGCFMAVKTRIEKAACPIGKW
jgi:hypothetical protein